MDFNILDKNFNIVSVLETMSSILWNERYQSYGDFQLSISAHAKEIPYLSYGNYISNSDSDRIMIIEASTPVTDNQDGSIINKMGRSLESVLLRRIIWSQTTISGNVQDGIERLLNENLISPEIESRRIPNFVFVRSDDERITSLTMNETQFTGDYLYDAIQSICKIFKIGFKVTLNEYNIMEFRLLVGDNRSGDNPNITQVTMSVENDNLISAKHSVDTRNYKNVTLIAGEGEGVNRKTAVFGESEGLERRECYTDARDISSNDGAINQTQYNNLLIERGKSNLAEYPIEEEVDAEIDTSSYSIFEYKKDYYMGDVVNVKDIYGNISPATITEMTTCVSKTGVNSHPIFSYKEDKNDD